MWKIVDFAFFERSPSEYIRIPHDTEQYGHVLRVSVALASLKSRTLATASLGEKPSSARLEPASDAPVNVRNSRLVMSVIASPLTGARRAGVRPSITRAPQKKGAVPYLFGGGTRKGSTPRTRDPTPFLGLLLGGVPALRPRRRA